MTNDNDGGRRARLTAAQERALKLLVELDNKGQPCALSSKTGYLSIGPAVALSTAKVLETLGYAKLGLTTVRITQQGRSALAGETAKAEAPKQWWVDQNNAVFKATGDEGDLYNSGCIGPFDSEAEAEAEVARVAKMRTPVDAWSVKDGYMPAPAAPAHDEAATLKQHAILFDADKKLIEAISKRWSNVDDCHGESICEEAVADIGTLLEIVQSQRDHITSLAATLRAALSRPTAALAVGDRAVVLAGADTWQQKHTPERATHIAVGVRCMVRSIDDDMVTVVFWHSDDEWPDPLATIYSIPARFLARIDGGEGRA